MEVVFSTNICNRTHQFIETDPLFMGKRMLICKGLCQLIDSDFIPRVSATCKQGHMSIKVEFNNSFSGAVHARDFRTPACMSHGDGSKVVTFDINLVAQPGSADYCGLLVNNKTEERSIPIAVRIHKTLELADDKFYVITCGKASFKNAKNETSLVTLKLLDDNRKVSQAVFSKVYTLKAEISRPDGMHGFRVKNCIVFNKSNTSAPLIDENGCPYDKKIISPFTYHDTKGYATAQIEMFRFKEGSDVHFQCDIGLCRGACPDPSCNGISRPLPTEEGVLVAATSVFVLDPGQAPLVSELCDDVGGIRPSWLLWLCITLGVLFLIMLIINIFLCSAMTCACASTEVIEKEPSIIEDYDPYRSWHGSQYGSSLVSGTR
ncbi:hypothetical protein WA026_012134 [Henosepilachna vigintioctopunctata]|uniref:ZP domain-containing protein n=1 Tax=Henosepilachna vigintioctopunctata TaxID=420089 RepID=A0AAW1VE92_9CUCU